MDVVNTDEFEPRTVDKVERLLDLVDEMERHPALKDKLALHGGTAINLFMLDVPRLSVDIDVSYIGSVSHEDMLVDRPRIEAGIEAVAQALGYAVELHPGGHAGRTFLLRYRRDWGVDHVKVRDLYDVSNLKSVYESLEPGEQEVAHQLALYYASLSACRSPHASRSRSRAGCSASRTDFPSSQTISTLCCAHRPSARPLRGSWRTLSASQRNGSCPGRT